MSLRRIVLAAALALLPAFAEAAPEKRVALVIGEGAYKTVPALENSVYDARAVADSFRELGFEVTDGYDLDMSGLRALLGKFVANLPDSSIAVVYYAGHGVSVDEENYLLPTDIALTSAADLDINALSVSLVMKQLKREERANVVILDACRNNPFAATLKKSKTRSLVAERGLSAIDGNLARGAMIAFASDPKSTALDGPKGDHSPFTKALLAHIKDSDAPIETVMARVRTEVYSATNQNQMPWVNTSLIGEVRLAGKDAQAPAQVAAVAPQAPAGEPRGLESQLWDSAQKSNLPADYQAYLDAYPNGAFAKMARNRIDAFKPAGPVAPSREALKAEVGTEDTETALKLDRPAVVEIHKRLALAKAYSGPAAAKLGAASRTAVKTWQRAHEVAPTGYLGPVQLAALKAETETDYQAHRDTAPAAAAPRPAPRTRAATSAEPRAAHPRRRAYEDDGYAERRGSGGGGGGVAPAIMGDFLNGLGHGIGQRLLNH